MQVSKKTLDELLGVSLSPKEIEEAYNLHAFEVEETEEVKGDIVFDIDVLPNRTSDALSWRGLAYELAAIKNIKLKKDPLLEQKEGLDNTDNNKLEVEVLDKEYCNIYHAALIENVEVKESPEWLKLELEKMGQKSINNIVDATNYVMFMLGQPMHAFDADKLSFKGGKYKIGVRKAQNQEKVLTLDDIEYELDERISVIFDANKETDNFLGIAGIKGGKNSGVDNKTTKIILEAARFNPTLTRKASEALKLRTDASKRFENDIPDKFPEIALAYAVKLIKEIAGGELVATASFKENERENPFVDFDIEKINKIIGTNIDKNTATDILQRLGFKIEQNKAQAPFWRTDINLDVDLAEEIMRLYGFYKLESRALEESGDKNLEILRSYYFSEELRRFLLDRGFIELTNSTLEDKGELKLKNSLSSEKNYFRDSVSYSVKKALDRNEAFAPLLGIYDAFKVFEIGTVYKNGKEKLDIAIAVRPVSKKKRESKAKAALEEIKQALEEKYGISLPEAGETLEFDINEVFEGKKEGDYYPELPVLPNIQYKPFSVYPFVLRDIAMWLKDKKDADKAEKIIKEEAGDYLKRIDLFDIFEKDGQTSFAWHLVFQSDEKTLTDEEVNSLMKKIESRLEKELSAKIR